MPLREHLGYPTEEIIVYDEVQQLPYVGEDVLTRFGVDTRMVQLPPTHVKGVEIVDDGDYWAMWDRWGSQDAHAQGQAALLRLGRLPHQGVDTSRPSRRTTGPSPIRPSSSPD